MKKSLHALFCTICALSFISSSVMAEDYTIEPKADGADAIKSRAVPLLYNSASIWGSVTQQIYLASELIDEGASAGNIDAIAFYYSAANSAVSALSRPIQIFMMAVSAEKDSFVVKETGYSDFLYVSTTNKTAGSRVYNGALATEAVGTSETKKVKIDFDDSFPWDGESNIVVTIFDMSSTDHTISEDGYTNMRFLISKTDHPRFLHKKWYSSYLGPEEDTRAAWIADMSNNLAGREGEMWSSGSTAAKQAANRSYVNKVDFSITPSAAPVVPSTPEDLAASNVGSTSASLSWSAVDGATSYDLYNSTSIDGVYSKFASPTTNSYDWSGLTANTTYYVKVAAANGAGSSDLSSAISFTTLAPHIHDDITFEPWSNPSAMPTFGNYYLATDVAFGWESSDVTLTGDLNLCLNGHEANLAFYKIVVPDDKTLAIYDNIGGGKITSFVASEVGAFDVTAKALICVYSGGTLVLKQGTIENTYEPDEDGESYAIYSNGTVRISGNVLINSNDADIYLYSTNIITLDGAISNAEKHTVYKSGGAITSGWSTHMSGEDPRDYFESANSARSVCLDEGEAALRLYLNLSESSLNSSISTSYDQLADVDLTRSLTSSQYNTFCLPFALSNAQLEDIFGAGYDLEEFDESSLDGELLTLVFNRVYELEAGKPYLLQPASNVADPSFEGVTITATSPVNVTTSYIDFKPVYGPTSLTGGNKNLLFLGADNELFWPDATGNLKGFRAYFEVKGGAALAAKRARIVKKEDSATGIESQMVNGKCENGKFIKDGQLLILRDNKTYNVIGQMVK